MEIWLIFKHLWGWCLKRLTFKRLLKRAEPDPAFFQLPDSMLSNTPFLNSRLPAILMGATVWLGITLLGQESFSVHQAVSIIDKLDVLYWSWWGP